MATMPRDSHLQLEEAKRVHEVQCTILRLVKGHSLRNNIALKSLSGSSYYASFPTRLELVGSHMIISFSRSNLNKSVRQFHINPIDLSQPVGAVCCRNILYSRLPLIDPPLSRDKIFKGGDTFIGNSLLLAVLVLRLIYSAIGTELNRWTSGFPTQFPGI